MENQKYVEYYVDIMTSTMHQAVIKNISLQANAKINEDVIKELSDKVNELQVLSANLDQELNNLREQFSKNESEKIKELQNVVNNLNHQLNDSYHARTERDNLRVERDNLSSQVQHIDTFRNQLIATQRTVDEKNNEINDLKAKIESLLNPTPIVKKRNTKPKLVEVPKEVEVAEVDGDGGTF